jgi:hypothetical protein
MAHSHSHLDPAQPRGRGAGKQPHGGRVQDYLDGIDYPAPRTKLIAIANENGAPPEVIAEIQRLPESVDFRSQEDVDQAFGAPT